MTIIFCDDDTQNITRIKWNQPPLDFTPAVHDSAKNWSSVTTGHQDSTLGIERFEIALSESS